MNKIIRPFICCLVLLLVGGATAYAQPKKVQGSPNVFETPLDRFDNAADYDKFISNDAKSRSKTIGWMVISDRNNNQTYKDPKEGAEKQSIINFKDVCYVVDDTEFWIHIVKAKVNGLKIVRLEEDLGWIEKKKMLLWNSGLVDPITKIHKKTFLLNKADDIAEVLRLDKKEIVPVYSGPNTDEKEPNRTIYKFYFVMKKENGSYLLAQEVNISKRTAATELVGWVRQNRCADWNTRIVLEPNFQQEAFDERKSGEHLQVKAFNDRFPAEAYSKGETVSADNIFWKNDPVTLDSDQLATEDRKRLKGGVMRFPMLKSNQTFFRSGIIGEIIVGKDGKGQLSFSNNKVAPKNKINENTYAGLKEDANANSAKLDNFNIFFVVEGTNQMEPYKAAIKESLDGIAAGLKPATVRFGVAVYRDVEETSKLMDIQNLTAKTSDIEQFLDRTEFNNWQGTGNKPALYYGMNEALRRGGFDEKHTNIIVIVGKSGDYRQDRAVSKVKKSEGHKTYIRTNDIAASMATMNVHLYGIQCESADTRQSKSFLKHARKLMLEAGKNVYNNSYGSDYIEEGLKEVYAKINYQKKPPSIADIDESNADIIQLENTLPGALTRNSSDGFGSITALRDAIEARVDDSYKYQSLFANYISDIYNVGQEVDLSQLDNNFDAISAGRFEAAMADHLFKQWSKRSNNVSQSDIVKSTEEKYQLYTDVYIPKKIRGAKYPLSSFVLFMPERDLKDYIATLKSTIGTIEGTYKDKRESLETMFVDLVEKFSGDATLSERSIGKDFSLNDVVKVMQGVYNEGLEISIFEDAIIQDIKNEKKISDDEIDNMIDRFQRVVTELEDIKRQGERYEFSYNSGENLYFWIPVEKAF